MSKKNILKNIDFKLILMVLALIVIGCIALWSATSEIQGLNELKKQIMWAVISFGVMGGLAFINYEMYEKIWPLIYGVTIVLLIGVLFTNPINGATSWYNLGFMSFQPSEVAKLALIISLSAVISKLTQYDEENINSLRSIAIIMAVILPPVLLIIKQPDYGTATVFIVFTAIMLFISKFKAKFIAIAAVGVVIAIPILYMFVLPPHAQNRIKVFLDPGLDPLGIGYNVLQSKLAIGSGMFTGMGLQKGNQTQLGYLHPKTTDFIFAVISEEMGFIVAGSVIIIFMFLIFRCIHISRTSKDTFGSLIAIGFAGMFMFYATENIGMTMGLLPITGVPLPFVSYGGSSLLSNMIAIGILLNISKQRNKVMVLGG